MIDEKIFRDPIYGYISIPSDYCKKFIDTNFFQRLRRIEQTSMRVLYPSAHHDRFAHSIGVFYLGQLAFTYLKNNSQVYFNETIDPDKWERYRKTFEIACLMHDCGHSPFSHTFEHYYLFKREDEIKQRISIFYNNTSDFSAEYDSASPAEHEKISALLILEQYKEKVEEIDACPLLAARMIMGIKHENNLDLILKFENKLISLLNGSGIDVDSLDYIQRDSWASGVSNVNIDYQRLLSALMFKPDENNNVKIVFKKKALSVLDNISIGRNFLYKWIYSHHKVLYEQEILTKIIETINSDSCFCSKIFSIEAFKEIQDFNGQKFYLPTDDDIIYTIKQYISDDSRITELLSRNYKYKALWKTYFEFNESHFKDVNNANRMSIASKIEKGALDDKYGKENIMCIKAKPKLKSINENDFFIEINDSLIDASKATYQMNENLSYFIIYVTDKIRSHKNNIIRDILALQT
jgi:hypothetical protein